MGEKSSKFDFDLNSNFALVNIFDFLASLSMINDASEKLTKLDDYIHELKVELIRIDDLKRELPLCKLLVNEGIERLKEVRMRTEAEARPLTREFSLLKDGENSNEYTGAQKSNDCWMSWNTNVQYENFVLRKQDFASNLKLDVKQENGSASKNSYDQICGKLKMSEGFSRPLQRQSGLIIKEKNNLLPVASLLVAVSGVKLGPTDIDSKQNMSKITNIGLPASISRVESSPFDMNLKQNMSKTSTGLPTSVPRVELDSNNMNLKRNISKTSIGSSFTTNPWKKSRRLCWSSELHNTFINTAQQLGGPNVSTSKQIRENMQVAVGLSNNEVESSLKICTSKLKKSEGHFGASERQSGVIINEKKNLVVANGPSSSLPGEEKGNILQTRSDLSLAVDPERKPRRCWSNKLQSIFVNVLQHLGGPDVATPKQIREMMQVDDLTNDEVKSHLQKYRLRLRKSPERSTASSSYIWPGRGCRHINMSKGSTSQSVSGPLNINGSAKEVSTTGGADNAPKNTAGGDENEAKNKDDEKSEDNN